MADEEGIYAVCGLMLFSEIAAYNHCASGKERENVEDTGSNRG